MIESGGITYLSSTDLRNPPCMDGEAGTAAKLGAQVHDLIHRSIRGLPLPVVSGEAGELFLLWRQGYQMPGPERVLSSESDTAPAAVRVSRIYPDSDEPRQNVRVRLSDTVGVQSSGDLVYYSPEWDGLVSDDWKTGRVIDDEGWLLQSAIQAVMMAESYPGYAWYEAAAVYVRYGCMRKAHRYVASEIPALRAELASRCLDWLAAKRADLRTMSRYCAPGDDGTGGCARRHTCPAYAAALRPFDAETLRADTLEGAAALDARLAGIERACDAARKAIKAWRLERIALAPVEAGRSWYVSEAEIPEATTTRRAYVRQTIRFRPATADEMARLRLVDALQAEAPVWPCLPDNPPVVEPAQDAIGLPAMVSTAHQITEMAGAAEAPPVDEEVTADAVSEASPGEGASGLQSPLPVQPADRSALPFSEPDPCSNGHELTQPGRASFDGGFVFQMCGRCRSTFCAACGAGIGEDDGDPERHVEECQPARAHLAARAPSEPTRARARRRGRRPCATCGGNARPVAGHREQYECPEHGRFVLVEETQISEEASA